MAAQQDDEADGRPAAAPAAAAGYSDLSGMSLPGVAAGLLTSALYTTATYPVHRCGAAARFAGAAERRAVGDVPAQRLALCTQCSWPRPRRTSSLCTPSGSRSCCKRRTPTLPFSQVCLNLGLQALTWFSMGPGRACALGAVRVRPLQMPARSAVAGAQPAHITPRCHHAAGPSLLEAISQQPAAPPLGLGRAGKVARYSFAHSFARLLREQGPAGLWRGNTPYLLRHVPSIALSFAFKDAIREAMLPRCVWVLSLIHISQGIVR